MEDSRLAVYRPLLCRSEQQMANVTCRNLWEHLGGCLRSLVREFGRLCLRLPVPITHDVCSLIFDVKSHVPEPKHFVICIQTGVSLRHQNAILLLAHSSQF